MNNDQWKAAKAEWEAAEAAFKTSPAYLAHQQAAAKWQAAWPVRAKWRSENLKQGGKSIAVAQSAIHTPVPIIPPISVVSEVPDPERVRKLINKVKNQ